MEYFRSGQTEGGTYSVHETNSRLLDGCLFKHKPIRKNAGFLAAGHSSYRPTRSHHAENWRKHSNQCHRNATATGAAEAAAATELYAPGSRDARMAEESVKELMKTLADSLQVELGLMQLRRKTLEENLEASKSQLKQLEEKSEEARTLQIAATIAKERYLQYMAKEEEARMDILKSKDKLVNVKVIEKPFRPADPVFPKTALFVLGAFFIAWPLGIGVILVANFSITRS